MIVKPKIKINPRPKITIAYVFGWIVGAIMFLPRLFFNQLFRLMDWDAKHYSLSLLIGIFLIIGVVNVPHIWQWQYWLFLLGMLLIIIHTLDKGFAKGKDMERKGHEEFFMCIPKEVIMKQAQEQTEAREMHMRIFHDKKNKEKEDNEKLPN